MRHRKVAAVEVLDRRRPQHVLGRFLGPFELRRDDPHVVAAAAELLLVRADRPRHAAHVRQVRVGEHHDSHGCDSLGKGALQVRCVRSRLRSRSKVNGRRAVDVVQLAKAGDFDVDPRRSASPVARRS